MPVTKAMVSTAQRGLIYIWVLLSVALIGLGLTVAVEVDATNTRRDKEKELLAIGRQFRVAIRSYYETPNASGLAGEYPARLEDLVEDTRGAKLHRHLRKVFVDPMTNQAQWGVIKAGTRIVGVYSLSEVMPIKQDGFEADDAEKKGAQKYSQWVFGYAQGGQLPLVHP